MTSEPEGACESATGEPGRWKLPPHIWHESARRAWLEAAEQAFREGFEQSYRESLAQMVILNLFYWRGIEVPESVRRKVCAAADLGQLQRWRDRAYEVSNPEDLFVGDRI